MPILIILGPPHHWLRQWPAFTILACAYMYACYFLLLKVNMPKLLIARRYSRMAATAGALVFLTWLLSLYPLPDMDFVTPALSEYQTRVRNFGVSVTLWLMFSLVIGYALTISVVKELYEQRDKAELAVFKAQISPHFLFNTLNSLYSLVIGLSDKAEDAFIKFTEILKYTYVTIEKDSVPLADEIAYIRSYIDLQEIRLNGHTRVLWHNDIDDPECLVPPMLMLTFVENAFKYGASTSRDCSIHIGITLHDGHLELRTSNSIMKHAAEFRTDMPVGIENSRARLATLFPGRHSLVTTECDGIFNVSLTIQLNRPVH